MNLRPEHFRLILTVLGATLVLWQRMLLPVLLGLLVYAWSCLLADRLAVRWGESRKVAAISAVTVGLMVLAALAGLFIWTVALASGDELRTFLMRIEHSLDMLREALPESLAQSIPENLIELRAQVFGWLKSHAASLGSFGGKVAHDLVQGIFAVLVGAMAAATTWSRGTLQSEALYMGRLLIVLERVVLAQARIAVFNTSMTALYLFVILPAFGYELPFRGLLCLFTLVTGVLPVLGNVLANTIVMLISLAISPWLAVSSLVYLILIHKTEYFINARTVGARVQVNAWEILAAMLTGEALFGVQGLVAAPLLYPFFKRELSRLKPAAAPEAAAQHAAQSNEPRN